MKDSPISLTNCFLLYVNQSEYIKIEQKYNETQAFTFVSPIDNVQITLNSSRQVTTIASMRKNFMYVSFVILRVKNTARPIKIKHTKIDIICAVENKPTAGYVPGRENIMPLFYQNINKKTTKI